MPSHQYPFDVYRGFLVRTVARSQRSNSAPGFGNRAGLRLLARGRNQATRPPGCACAVVVRAPLRTHAALLVGWFGRSQRSNSTLTQGATCVGTYVLGDLPGVRFPKALGNLTGALTDLRRLPGRAGPTKPRVPPGATRGPLGAMGACLRDHAGDTNGVDVTREQAVALVLQRLPFVHQDVRHRATLHEIPPRVHVWNEAIRL